MFSRAFLSCLLIAGPSAVVGIKRKHTEVKGNMTPKEFCEMIGDGPGTAAFQGCLDEGLPDLEMIETKKKEAMKNKFSLRRNRRKAFRAMKKAKKQAEDPKKGDEWESPDAWHPDHFVCKSNKLAAECYCSDGDSFQAKCGTFASDYYPACHNVKSGTVKQVCCPDEGACIKDYEPPAADDDYEPWWMKMGEEDFNKMHM